MQYLPETFLPEVRPFPELQNDREMRKFARCYEGC